MPTIENKQTFWEHQPDSVVNIDWNNPLSKGLVSYIPLRFRNFRDLVKPLNWTTGYAASMSSVAISSGMGTKFGISSGNSYIYSSWTGAFSVPFSVAFWYKPTEIVGTSIGLISASSDGNPISGAPQFLLARNSATFRAYTSSAGYFITTGNVFTANSVYLCVFSHNGTTGTCYINGISQGSSNTSMASSSPTNLFVGSGYINPINDGIQDFAFWYGRSLSDTDVKEYYANPWQILRVSTRTIFPVTSGTQSQTVTPSGGITFGGAVTKAFAKVKDVSGGIAFGGSASVSFVGLQTQVVTPSGGLTFGGSSAQSITRPESVSGGIQFGGSATVETHESVRTVTPSGGITFGGSASVVFPSLMTLFPYRRFIYGRKGLLDRKISRQ